MLIKICDRCGKFCKDELVQGDIQTSIKEIIIADYRKQSCEGYHFKETVLCSECTEDFLTWFNKIDLEQVDK